MKRKGFILIMQIIVMMLLPFTMYAQDITKHIEFLGIPIDGNIDVYAKKLAEKGFTVISRDDDMIKMKGQFTGKEATVYIVGTAKTKTTWKVNVYLPEDASWYSIKSDYKYYKDTYSAKYGKPKDVYEFFSKPYYEGDGYEMSAIRNGKCHYAAFYDISGGVIALDISKLKRIRIAYEDSVNSELMQSEKNSVVTDDI